MKKVVVVFVIILIAVGATLSILSAGDEYGAERLFYYAMKPYRKISVNPDVAPPGMVATVENRLKGVLEKYPGKPAAKAAHLKLIELYVFRKRYDDVISTADSFLATYKDDPASLSRAQFLKTTAYQRKGQWDKAEKAYMVLRDTYPGTFLGLNAPLYVARYYKQNGMEKEAEDAYSEAIAYYIGLEKENRKTVLGYAASNVLLRVYMSLERYQDAGGVVEDLIANYPSVLTLRQHLPNVEFIFVKLLKNPQKAIAIYKSIQEKVKDEKFKEFLQKKIDALEETPAQQVTDEVGES